MVPSEDLQIPIGAENKGVGVFCSNNRCRWSRQWRLPTLSERIKHFYAKNVFCLLHYINAEKINVGVNVRWQTALKEGCGPRGCSGPVDQRIADVFARIEAIRNMRRRELADICNGIR